MARRRSNDAPDDSVARRSATAVVTREPTRSVVAGTALGALVVGAALRRARARRRRPSGLASVLRG